MTGNLEENYTILYYRGLQVCVPKQMSETDFPVCLHFQIWHLSPKNKRFDFLSCVIKFKVLYGQGYVLVIYLAVFGQICFDLYLLQCQETYWVTLRLVFK